MNLQQQCLSLDLAKRLKELNIAQESLFYWSNNHEWLIEYNDRLSIDFYEHYSAFTAGELMEIFPPPSMELDYWMMKIKTSVPESLWQGETIKNNKSLMIFNDELEVNLKAKMLIYLYEQGLITNE